MIQKIAFTGSHGTGKTTLVRAILHRLKSLKVRAEIIEEIPRIICDEAGDPEFFRRGKNSPLKQALLMQRQVQLEIAMSDAEPDVLLCDRGVLDHWVYTKHLFPQEFEDQGVYATYEKIVSEHCGSYTNLFYVPIEFAPADDGVREADSRFQRDIDKSITEFVETHGLRCEKVFGSLENRIDQVFLKLQLK